MVGLRVFLSSTYLDNRDLRESLLRFLSDMKIDVAAFERGGVFYTPGQTVTQSCKAEVRKCDLMLLVIGGKYGSSADSGDSGRRPNSYVREEYKAAVNHGLHCYVFIKKEVLVEFGTYKRNLGKRVDIDFLQVDSIRVFELIGEVEKYTPETPLIAYETPGDIESFMKLQFASLLRGAYLKRRSSKQVVINPYKLYYYRGARKLSKRELARRARVPESLIKQLERVPRDKVGRDTRSFRTCSTGFLGRIEAALDCRGALTCGRPDDNHSHLLEYYMVNKYGVRFAMPVGTAVGEATLYPVRLAVFDFDGTLTHPGSQNLTTWEMLWQAVGLDVEECGRYLVDFLDGRITHPEWCDITSRKWRQAGMRESHLRDVARKIRLLPGTAELLRALRDAGVGIYIVSGSIHEVIKIVLGELWQYCGDVKSNHVIFSESGELAGIQGTQYDFQGKAQYVSDLIKQRMVAPLETLFVGNSLNDVWVGNSGARTLCINPYVTDGFNKRHWSAVRQRVSDLRELLPFFNLGNRGVGPSPQMELYAD
ncbi:MAG: HAD-IB family phosphatase [Planctomycetota bacterium]